MRLFLYLNLLMAGLSVCCGTAMAQTPSTQNEPPQASVSHTIPSMTHFQVNTSMQQACKQIMLTPALKKTLLFSPFYSDCSESGLVDTLAMAVLKNKKVQNIRPGGYEVRIKDGELHVVDKTLREIYKEDLPLRITMEDHLSHNSSLQWELIFDEAPEAENSDAVPLSLYGYTLVSKQPDPSLVLALKGRFTRILDDLNTLPDDSVVIGIDATSNLQGAGDFYAAAGLQRTHSNGASYLYQGMGLDIDGNGLYLVHWGMSEEVFNEIW